MNVPALCVGDQQGAYAASKGAVSQLTRQMAKGMPLVFRSIMRMVQLTRTVCCLPACGARLGVPADYAADGIRSNAVCPGSVATAVLDKYLSDQAEGDPEGRDVDYFLDEISSSHPVGRIANAEEVARFYV